MLTIQEFDQKLSDLTDLQIYEVHARLQEAVNHLFDAKQDRTNVRARRNYWQARCWKQLTELHIDRRKAIGIIND